MIKYEFEHFETVSIVKAYKVELCCGNEYTVTDCTNCTDNIVPVKGRESAICSILEILIRRKTITHVASMQSVNFFTLIIRNIVKCRKTYHFDQFIKNQNPTTPSSEG